MSHDPLTRDSFLRISYRPPVGADHLAVCQMARRCFSDTFAHHYDPVPFAAFLDGAYGPGGSMQRDLDDTAVRWRVAFADDTALPVAYAKLTPLRAPAPSPEPGALELQQLYVLADWHGRGVADALMQWALAEAEVDRAPEVYLTVFDHNAPAKRFYTRYGFSEVGHCTFTVGDRVDDDRVWRRPM